MKTLKDQLGKAVEATAKLGRRMPLTTLEAEESELEREDETRRSQPAPASFRARTDS